MIRRFRFALYLVIVLAVGATTVSAYAAPKLDCIERWQVPNTCLGNNTCWLDFRVGPDGSLVVLNNDANTLTVFQADGQIRGAYDFSSDFNYPDMVEDYLPYDNHLVLIIARDNKFYSYDLNLKKLIQIPLTPSTTL